MESELSVYWMIPIFTHGHELWVVTESGGNELLLGESG